MNKHSLFALLLLVFGFGLSNVSAQEQQEKKVTYNFINEYGYIAEYDARDVIYCIGERKESYEQAKETVAEWNK